MTGEANLRGILGVAVQALTLMFVVPQGGRRAGPVHLCLLLVSDHSRYPSSGPFRLSHPRPRHFIQIPNGTAAG